MRVRGVDCCQEREQRFARMCVQNTPDSCATRASREHDKFATEVFHLVPKRTLMLMRWILAIPSCRLTRFRVNVRAQIGLKDLLPRHRPIRVGFSRFFI